MYNCFGLLSFSPVFRHPTLRLKEDTMDVAPIHSPFGERLDRLLLIDEVKVNCVNRQLVLASIICMPVRKACGK